jgi:rhamnosyltransferase subunit B
MANLLLSTHGGTRGDLNPIACIGIIMRARGHRVTVITHCHFEGVIRRAGLEFVAVDSPDEFDRYSEDSAMMHTPRGQIAFFRKHRLPRAIREYELLKERCNTPDTVLITRELSILGPQAVAEKLRLPLVRVFGGVAYMTQTPMLEIMCDFLATDINHFREKVGLSPVVDWHTWVRFPRCSIGAWPDWFASPEPDWPEGLNLVAVGFLPFDDAEVGEIPVELQRFLESGSPPILITGGTGGYLRPEFYAVCLEACQQLGRRSILVARQRCLIPKDLPDQARWFDFLPFADVMPHMAAVVHHGGTGTLTRALSLGIPQLSLAAGTDRPDTARRFRRLGVAEYLPPSRWQPKLIADTLHNLLSSVDVQKNCQEMARRMREADPSGAVCEIIEGLIASPLEKV